MGDTDHKHLADPATPGAPRRVVMSSRMQEGSGPRLIVSPHLDDAVLACGDMLARHPGSLVVTVFSGRPPAAIGLAPWDADAGFVEGDDVIGIRRGEDRRALAHLAARPLWLRFRDAQYGRTASVHAVARALGRVIRREAPAAVYFPLGLFHSDHLLASEACLRLAERDSRREWIAYADALYRSLDDFLARRLDALRARGIRLTAVTMPRRAAAPPKRRAVAEYASQLRALRTPGRLGLADALKPERTWRIGR